MKKNVAKLLAGIIVCAMLAGCGGSEQKPEPMDRFGNVAYYEKGAFVNQAKLDRVINYFLSDEYTQSTALTQAPEPKPGKNAGEEALAAALNAEGGSLRFYNSEDSTVWPMVPTEKDGRKGVMTTNMQVDNSTSSIYLAVNAAEGDVLSFDYSMSAAAYKTRLTILIDGEGVKCSNGIWLVTCTQKRRHCPSQAVTPF